MPSACRFAFIRRRGWFSELIKIRIVRISDFFTPLGTLEQTNRIRTINTDFVERNCFPIFYAGASRIRVYVPWHRELEITET